MHVDIGNALAAVADPGISRSNLERLDRRVATAHERIEARRDEGEHGYAALNLPDRTDPAAIREAVEPLSDADAVVTAGIGGSSLGAATITDALGDETDCVYLDNVDPDWVRSRLDGLDLESTAIVAVSRSGTTAETLATFLVCREAFEAAGVDWTERTLVITGEGGPLRELADEQDLQTLSVPDGVPGRFSALSTVGLAVPAIAGVDVEGLLAGGRAGAASLSPSLFDCPAYAYGSVSYALAERGASVNAMMPYAESLETFAEWFAQLWAESLGKDGLGQTPARALGATDQHSQLQLYRAGPRDKLVSFVAPGDREPVPVPDPGHEALSYLDDATLGDLLDAELDATEASLAAADRPSVRVEMDAVDAESLGELLYGFEAACVLAGELFGVDAFDQPAVEWGKEAARDLLRTGDLRERPATETLRVD